MAKHTDTSHLSPSEVEETFPPDLEDGPDFEDEGSEPDEPQDWMTEADREAEADRAAARYESQF